MPDLLIRDLSQEQLDALTAHAQADSMERGPWVRATLIKIAGQPLIKQRYVLKAWDGVGSENGYGASATIRRIDDLFQHGANNMSAPQMNAYKKACDYVARNGAGDREKALGLLQSVFEEVFELPA